MNYLVKRNIFQIMFVRFVEDSEKQATFTLLEEWNDSFCRLYFLLQRRIYFLD